MKKTLNILASIVLLLSLWACNSEQKDFNKAVKANTIDAFKDFATKYPNSDYVDSARGIIDNMVWKSVVSIDSIKRYQLFISEYPRNKFVDSAKTIVDNAMWQTVKSSNLLEDYETFVEEYPDSKFIDSAKIMIEKQKPATDN